MGAVAAVVRKDNRDATKTVFHMLRELQHRGRDAHGIASYNQVFHAKNFRKLETVKLDAPAAVGYNLSKIFPQDKKQPQLTGGFALTFDGRIYPFQGKAEIAIAKELLQSNPKKARRLISELDGDFVFIIATETEIVAGRSAVGVCPLYYGENHKLAAVASEKKALWRIGLKNPYSFPPGSLAVLNAEGFHFRKVKTLSRPTIRETRMEQAVEHTSRLLMESVKKRLRDVKSAAVAFSGGVDSSLLAFLAKKCGVNPTLIWAGLRNQIELKHAEEAGDALGLRLETKICSERDVLAVLPRVLWLIEEPDPVKTCIAVPFYWAAEKASELGFNVMLAGQGSDELFGGYKRYLNTYSTLGSEGLEAQLFHDVSTAYQTNYERDNKICAFHGVELRLPFADYSLSTYALTIAAELKIASKQDAVRKHVLRQAALKLGLPRFMAEKPKKAIQYATGVAKTLKKLARNNGLPLKTFLEKLWMEQRAGFEA